MSDDDFDERFDMTAWGGEWSFSFTEKDVVEGGAATVLHYDYEKELQHKKKPISVFSVWLQYTNQNSSLILVDV